jgi:branched-chain amino acid transport system permease protein
LFLDSPASALVYGCAVALLGTGFTLVHVSSDFPHLGLVQHSVLGAYVGYTLFALMGLSPYLGLPLAFLVGGCVNVAFYLTVVAAMQKRGRSDVMLAISTLAGSIVMVALVNMYAYWIRETFHTYSMAFVLRDAWALIASFVVLAASVLILRRLLSGTRLGVAVRGSAESRELASVCGVDPFRVQAFSWFVAGGLASTAGLLFVLQFVGDTSIWMILFTVTFAASFLGGIDSALWAPLGVLIVVSTQYAAEILLMVIWGEHAQLFSWLIPLLFLSLTLYLEPGGLAAVYDRIRSRRGGTQNE